MRSRKMTRFVCYALTCAYAGAAAAADLVDVFRLAQSADATYASARATWSAAQERIPQGRSGLLPLVSAAASAQYTDRTIRFRDIGLPNSSSAFGSTSFSLSVTQPLYRRQNMVVYEQAF
jgi:outer membrane protein